MRVALAFPKEQGAKEFQTPKMLDKCKGGFQNRAPSK